MSHMSWEDQRQTHLAQARLYDEKASHARLKRQMARQRGDRREAEVNRVRAREYSSEAVKNRAEAKRIKEVYLSPTPTGEE